MKKTFTDIQKKKKEYIHIHLETEPIKEVSPQISEMPHYTKPRFSKIKFSKIWIQIFVSIFIFLFII